MTPSFRFGTDGGRSFQVLWEDGERVICRGWRPAPDGQRSAVLAVRPAAEHAAPASLNRLAHEYGLRDELDGAGAVRPLEFMREDGRTMLVLEDPGGEPLARLLGAPMEVGLFLRLAVGIASALGRVHQRGLVHKDLKPAHVFVIPMTGEVRLTGFGIASRLSRERQAPEPPETIAGTLAYMAPEQTGRMNRSIDARSDLYALGVMFYEMLTGALPFNATDPMEWVHCHIARKPVPPAERLQEVPGTVSAVVMKLLAKTAEERYQTANGVGSDLRRCLAEWEAQGRIDDFPLGAHDTPDRLLIPERLYGREREVGALLAAFDRVVQSGAPELVLVSGYSGIGKSAVVHELHKALVPPRGLFAAGKFDQYKRNIPYATLAQAFQHLLHQLLGTSDAELDRWRIALREALGPNGQFMVTLVPELALIIGEQPPVPDLPPQDQQVRFQSVFRRFLGVFARPEHPLALFLDDLQWLDAATLDLIEHLVAHPEVHHLLVIGAYRDNEVGPTHPLARTRATIRGAGGRMREIRLPPLGPCDVARLLTDALQTDDQRVRPLADLVFDKTAGNPFFTIQFLLTLADEDLLVIDPGLAAWTWDLPRIRAQGFTDNVADLMAAKLRRLPRATHNAVRQLACLGNTAATATLTLVYGGSEEAIHAALWDAVRASLVRRSDNAYAFLHDRIHEAAYALIPEGERAVAHLRIGRALAAGIPAAEVGESIFDIVNQFDRGAALITTQEERERVAQLNLMAGQRAKAGSAYAAALQYFASGRALLGETGWDQCYRLTFDLELNWAECEYLTGALASAEEQLARLSRRAQTIVDAAAVTCGRVDLYTTLDRSDRAVAVGLEYLRRVDGRWSRHPTEEDVRRNYDRLWQQLGSREIEALLDLPPMSDPDRLATMDVLAALLSPARFTDLNLFRLFIVRMVGLSLEHGNTDASCLAYALLGSILGTYSGSPQAGFRFGRLALDLVDKHGLDRFRARVYQVFAIHVAHWTQPLQTSRAFLQRAFEAAREAGDLTFAAFARVDLVSNLLATGEPLDEVEREAESALEFVRDARFGLISDVIVAQLRLIRTLRGLTPDFTSFDESDFRESDFEQRLENNPRLAVAASRYWLRKLQASVYAGNYACAVAAASRTASLLWTLPSQIELPEYHFYAALARAGRCDSTTSKERRRDMKELQAHYKQLAAWAESGPENFTNRVALVGAEVARLEGRLLDAIELYEQAIGSARANGFIQNEALGYELAARFYAARGFEKFASVYMREARYCYLRWGAAGKVRQLEETYAYLRQEDPAPAPMRTITAQAEALDLATVIKVSQAVSGEIVLDKMLDMLMRTAIEQAGADRGLLILSQGGEQRIAAEAMTNGNTVVVQLLEQPVTAAVLPESIAHYVMRTRESVILDDASAQTPYSTDPYIRGRKARSILCLPLLNQAKLIGVLYLENNLAPRVFAPGRITVLKLLASQAATALESSRLFRDLAEREAKIRRLVDANIIGVVISGPEGEVIEANDAFLEILGYTRKDLAAGPLRWTELPPAEGRATSQRVEDQLRATGASEAFEKELVRKDGSRVPVLIGAAALEGRGQTVAFVLDLTERKQAEQALRDSEERFRTLVEFSFDIYWESDVQHRFTRLEFAESLADMPVPHSEIGKSRWELPHLEPDADTWRKHRETLDAHLPFRDFELARPTPGGSKRYVSVSGLPMFDETGRFIGYRGVARHITERKRAEEALRESEARFRTFVDHATDAFMLHGEGGTVLDVNRHACESLGYSRDELIGMTLLDFDLDVNAATLQHYRERLRAGETLTFESRHRRKDGAVFPVEIRVRELEQGEQRSIISLTRDITERRQAAEALREMQMELAHVNRVATMGQLTASIAHEVNQPIAAAVTNAQAALRWLGARPPDLGEVRQALGRIVESGGRAGEVIGRIRDLIKKAPPRKGRFDINGVIIDVMALTRSEVLKRGVSVQTQLAESLPSIHGDRVQLQQVLLNLILNAVEAMSDLQEGARELQIRTRADAAGSVLVTVQDSGPGLDPTSVTRLFDAFYTTKPEGLGMGLAICRSIIEAHGGRLWASANESRGAEFQFFLPTELDETAAAEPASAMPAG